MDFVVISGKFTVTGEQINAIVVFRATVRFLVGRTSEDEINSGLF